MNKEVTCILTSCGRFDLLATTLSSFFKHNTYDITEFWIYEDSGLPIPQEFIYDYPFIRWIEPGKRTGQIAALDDLWQRVKTPYAFTMEDDWETLKGGFIEESMDIMESNEKILQVWIKRLEDQNTHPMEWVTQNVNVGYIIGFGVFKPGTNLWAWHRFNPSLKRKADYDLIAPFSKHTEWNPAKPWKSEADISKVYNNLGFTAAILTEVCIKHIGEARHVS